MNVARSSVFVCLILLVGASLAGSVVLPDEGAAESSADAALSRLIPGRGPVCDGETDATNDIQAAVDAGGFVHLPACDVGYRVTSTINLTSGVTLEGDGGTTTRIDASEVPAGTAVFLAYDVHNVTIRGLYIVGSNVAHSKGGAIMFSGDLAGCTNCRADGNWIERANIGIHVGGGSSRFVIEGNTITESAGATSSGYGILVGGSGKSGSTRLGTVIHNQIVAPDRHGIYLGSDNSGHLVAFNTIVDAGHHGIQIYQANIEGKNTANITDVTVQGNRIVRPAVDGILVMNSNTGPLFFYDIALIGNVVLNPVGTGIAVRSANASRIEDNYVGGAGVHGILLNRGTVSGKPSSGNVVSGNVVENTGRRGWGIYVEQTDGSTVTGNQVRFSANDGIRLAVSSIDNIITANDVHLG